MKQPMWIERAQHDIGFVRIRTDDLRWMLDTMAAMGYALGQLVELKDVMKAHDPERYERLKPGAWDAARLAVDMYKRGPEVDEG